MKLIKYSNKDIVIAKNSIKEIKKILPSAKCKLIGSAAIPMIGKKEFDILVIIGGIKASVRKLKLLGYQGTIIKNKAYVHKRIKDFTIELHLVKLDSKMIDYYKKYIRILKRDISLRKRYEKFKASCRNLSKKDYKVKKSNFIKNYVLSEETK